MVLLGVACAAFTVASSVNGRRGGSWVPQDQDTLEKQVTRAHIGPHRSSRTTVLCLCLSRPCVAAARDSTAHTRGNLFSPMVVHVCLCVCVCRRVVALLVVLDVTRISAGCAAVRRAVSNTPRSCRYLRGA